MTAKVYPADAAPNRLDVLRAKLDRVDDRLLHVIKERIDCCTEIAHVKRKDGVPMMQPHRIGLVQQRAASYGTKYGLDQNFLRRLYELIIGETCRIEDLVIAKGTTCERS